MFDEIPKLLASTTTYPNDFSCKSSISSSGLGSLTALPIAPFLSIVAPQRSPRGALATTGTALQAFTLVDGRESRWSLDVADVLETNLLLDAAELSVPVQKFLRASNSQGIHFPRKGQALDLYCAKAVCSSEPLRDPSLASLALQISLAPTRRALPDLSEEASHQIAEEFQAKMLMYRIKKYSYVRPPDFDVAGLTAPTQCLARSLAACIVDDCKLQVGLVALLRQQDQEFQVERSVGIGIRHSGSPTFLLS